MSETSEGVELEKGKTAIGLRLPVGRRTTVLLMATNIVLAASLVYLILQNSQLAQNGGAKFDLLSAKIAWLDVDDFLVKQKNMTVSYAPMKQSLLAYQTAHGLQGRYSVYFEDMTTGRGSE